MQKKLLTTMELAEHFGVTRAAVGEWRKEEGFPYYNLGVKNFRYDLDAVKEHFKNFGRGRRFNDFRG